MCIVASLGGYSARRGRLGTWAFSWLVGQAVRTRLSQELRPPSMIRCLLRITNPSKARPAKIRAIREVVKQVLRLADFREHRGPPNASLQRRRNDGRHGGCLNRSRLQRRAFRMREIDVLRHEFDKDAGLLNPSLVERGKKKLSTEAIDQRGVRLHGRDGVRLLRVPDNHGHREWTGFCRNA